MLFNRCEIGDRIYALGTYAELQREFHVALAEGVYEVAHLSARRLPDTLFLSFAVGHRRHAVVGESPVVGLAPSPIALAPAFLASCTASEPTPPAAPETTTVSRGRRDTARIGAARR